MLASTFVIKTNLNILASIYSPKTLPHNKLLYTVYNSGKKSYFRLIIIYQSLEATNITSSQCQGNWVHLCYTASEVDSEPLA